MKNQPEAEYKYQIKDINATDEQLGELARSVFANCGAVMESMVINERVSDSVKRNWLNDLIRWCGAERFLIETNGFQKEGSLAQFIQAGYSVIGNIYSNPELIK